MRCPTKSKAQCAVSIAVRLQRESDATQVMPQSQSTGTSPTHLCHSAANGLTG